MSAPPASGPATTSRPVIRVLAPGAAPVVHRLAAGETVVGRDARSGLPLDDSLVSRRHASLVVNDGTVWLTDQSSRNGTFLNGRRVGTEAVCLTAGDSIRIGEFTLVVEAEATIPFTEHPGSNPLREVARQAPVEVLRSEVVSPAAATPAALAAVTAELEKKTRVIALFYELSRTLGGVFALEDVYDKVITLLFQVTPAARVIIFQVDARGEMPHVAARLRPSAGLAGDAVSQPLRVSRTVFDKVARQRVSVLLDNARPEAPVLPDSVRLTQTHSVMAAPVVGRRGLLGLIYVDQQDVRQSFAPDDLDLLNAVAVQTGIALDTVHAHQSLQREAKAREKYERFLPQQIVDDVMLDPDREVAPGGVRQTVTVLFADLRGFTTLAEDTAPEAVVDLLNRFFSLMSEVIFRHGGTLDKYIGDGVMALFGAPYPTERDAVKAVRAAVDMQRAVEGWNEERRAAGLADVGVGIGINSGPAIVGFIGSASRLDYTAIGDTVNMASRLEHLAVAGQIIVSEYTMRALDAGVPYTVLDPVQVKGRAARLQIGEIRWRRGG